MHDSGDSTIQIDTWPTADGVTRKIERNVKNGVGNITNPTKSNGKNIAGRGTKPT